MLGQADHFIEPKVQIGDWVLNESQAMAVRVAVTSFHSDLVNGEAARLGDIGRGYQNRLEQVLSVWLEMANKR